MEKLKSFWTDLFTELNSEESIAILVFLGVAFLIGLLFGAWSRAGKIRRLKKERDNMKNELTTFKAQYDTLVNQYEEKEEALKKADARINELSADINRLTNERMHYKTELESAREQIEQLQHENIEYINQINSGGGIVDVNTTGSNENTGNSTAGVADSPSGGALIDELQDDRLSLIEEKLERLVLDNANLREEIANLEKNVVSGATSNPVVVTGGANEDSGISSGSTSTTNIETGEAVLDLSETSVDEAPSNYQDEVLGEDEGEVSPQERAERAKSQIGAALGVKIPKANLSEKDDLKSIEGIGPFIETKLNDVGIYTYEQLSMLDEELIGLITDAIQFFPGRIEKDDWKGQAASLMG